MIYFNPNRKNDVPNEYLEHITRVVDVRWLQNEEDYSSVWVRLEHLLQNIKVFTDYVRRTHSTITVFAVDINSPEEVLLIPWDIRNHFIFLDDLEE